MNIYKSRIEELRVLMRENKIDYYLVFTSDPHSSEYINDYYKEREYLTGFTGSNGTLLVSMEEALLWTDGRYFVQADKELEGSDIKTMKSLQKGVPSISEYLEKHLSKDQCLGLSGLLISASVGMAYSILCEKKEAILKFDIDLPALMWKDRPLDSSKDIWFLEDCGESRESKLERVRSKLEDADYLILSKLDDIMWLFNIRGNDIMCNPVAYSYALIGKDEAILYLKNQTEVKGVTVKAYRDAVDDIVSICTDKKVMLDVSASSYYLYSKLTDVIIKPNCTESFKAIKNSTEIGNLKECYLKDSVVLTKFIRYIKENVSKKKITEIDAAIKLDSMRADIDGFVELSFPTISAYGANAAMMHYEATEEDYAVIEPKGMYLVDSGGTYMNGTTDVTRTLILGDVTKEMVKHFTKVACGMLRLQNASFIKGCTGRNLDILARLPLWELGIDYKCGTGHGIGYILNVHEGPHSIRWARRQGEEETVIVPGMIVSDEPGVYIEDSHGIRTENIIICESRCENEDGEFLGFVPLTLVPIDLDGIDKAYMNDTDILMLNEYHKLVFDRLSPFFEGEELEWLKTVTRSI